MRTVLTRAREGLDAELAMVRASLSGLRSGVRRRRWRDASQRRTTTIAAVIRHVGRTIVGAEIERRKIDGVWVFSAAGVDALLLDARTPGRTLSDLLLPPHVKVLHEPAVQRAELEAMARRGMFRLEVSCG